MTGVTSGKLGIWLFLASEVMLFGALFSSYVVLRVGALEANWPLGVDAGLNVPIGTFNTAVLITSSITMVMSWASLKLNDVVKRAETDGSPLRIFTMLGAQLRRFKKALRGNTTIN